MRLAALLAHDVRLQYRYGIYAAYAFIVAVYAGVLHWGAPYLPGWAVAFIIFTDPAALGFFFLGALMMLEKSELVRLALATTPMTALEYYTSKLVTLLALTLVACLCLLIVHSGEDNLALLLAAVSLTSIQYVGLGVLVAYHFATVNGYLIGSAVVLTPVIAPGLLALIDPMPAWLMLVPAASQLRLTMVATGAASANGAEILAMLAVSGAAAILASWAAVRRLRREFGK